MKIVLPQVFWNQQKLFELKQKHPEFNFVTYNSPDEFKSNIHDADVISNMYEWTIECHKIAKNVKWLYFMSGGVTLIEELVHSKILISSIKSLFSVPGSEFAIGAMLMFSRRLNYITRQHPNEVPLQMWENIPEPQNLAGKTVGIIGFGYMGQAIAKSASLLGMNVIATSRTDKKETRYLNSYYSAENIPTLLSLSDYVLLSIPITKLTEKYVDNKFLSHMKSTAILIDISGRAGLFDWYSLVDAINSKSIAGVLLQPPGKELSGIPSPKSSFWKQDNVIISPMRITSESILGEICDLFSTNLKKFCNNEDLIGTVNKKAGY